MKRLAIIPSRGGSKRLPDKNILDLDGKPLICHSIDAAIKSELFDKIIAASDSEVILDIISQNYNYKEYTKEKLTSDRLELCRIPDHLTTDTSKVLGTVNYFYDMNKEYDQIWLLLPTCPLRNEEDLKEADHLLTTDLDGVVSITEMEFPPTLGLNKDGENIITAYDKELDPWVNGNSRSQDHEVVYRPNGAIYASWCNKFEENRNFYKGKVKGYFMPRSKSIDIDTKFDLELAKQLVKKENE